jgi:hypothetical protein
MTFSMVARRGLSRKAGHRSKLDDCSLIKLRTRAVSAPRVVVHNPATSLPSVTRAPEFSSVAVPVTRQRAGIGRAVVGDRSCAVRGDDANVEVHQSYSRHATRLPDPVRAMTHRAGESIAGDVQRVLFEAGVGENLIPQIVALGTEGIGSRWTEVRGFVEISVWDGLARRCPGRQLREFVPALQNVCPLGPVRPVGSTTSEFTIVVAVVAVRAQYPIAHETPVCGAIKILHVGKDAGLGERTVEIAHHRVAGDRAYAELRDNVQGIASRIRSRGQISKAGA